MIRATVGIHLEGHSPTAFGAVRVEKAGMSDTQGKRTIIGPASAPRLPRHVKMRHDAQRGRWLILAPERVFTPDAIAVAVLKLCDGEHSVEAIAAELAKAYDAPAERILADIVRMLQGLADKGVVAP
jgi:pyrroloquinoline quinone biosynthesis protein D